MKRRTFLGSAACLATLGYTENLVPQGLAASQQKLKVVSRVLDVNGKAAKVYGLIGPDGRQGLSLDSGSSFNVLLQNQLDESTMIHWHGLTPPVEFDGVPNLPMPMLQAGEARAYKFLLERGGTNWMHAHTLQEQNLLAAPLIVHTAEDKKADEQEVIVLLHDFSFTSAEELLANLKGKGSSSEMMDHSMMDHGTVASSDPNMGNMAGMDMAGMDLNDIAYDAYLANDRTLDDPEVVNVEKGARIRLRIINGATATGFTVDLGQLSGELIAVDGMPVVPITGRLFPLSMGQRIDLRILLPKEVGSFPVLARREGALERAGIILATKGGLVRHLPIKGDKNGPVLDLGLETNLKSAVPLTVKPADRTFVVHLTGNMMGYTWAMSSEPLVVRKNERFEIELMNMSMMAHPMHLHGHHFQIVAINGQRFAGAMRDTILVPPMQRVTFAAEADNVAKAWAFHCHHLYHMASGMMSTLSYEDA